MLSPGRREAMMVRMGINHDGSAYVTVGRRSARSEWTEYRVTPREKKHEYGPMDYEVTLVCGRDQLDHDEVRHWAHDAFLDAYGAH